MTNWTDDMGQFSAFERSHIWFPARPNHFSEQPGVNTMIYRLAPLFAACIFLAGCAGRNYVDTFEPVVDMQNINHSAYEADLSACRQYAVREDPANKAMRGALAGAIAGALVGAAVGSAFGHVGNGAGYGALYGTAGGAAHGAVTGMRAQQLIVSRCLAGRGYKVLYGGDLAQ